MTKNQEQTPWKEMSYDQKEAIRQAHAEGKKIQYTYVHGLGVWYDDEEFTPDEPPYNFLAYRIAPDQEPRTEGHLSISLSSEDMDALRELAQERDTSPEELAARWLSVNIQLMAD